MLSRDSQSSRVGFGKRARNATSRVEVAELRPCLTGDVLRGDRRDEASGPRRSVREAHASADLAWPADRHDAVGRALDGIRLVEDVLEREEHLAPLRDGT